MSKRLYIDTIKNWNIFASINCSDLNDLWSDAVIQLIMQKYTLQQDKREKKIRRHIFQFVYDQLDFSFRWRKSLWSFFQVMLMNNEKSLHRNWRCHVSVVDLPFLASYRKKSNRWSFPLHIQMQLRGEQESYSYDDETFPGGQKWKYFTASFWKDDCWLSFVKKSKTV